MTDRSNAVVCNCADVPPTMPTCRSEHLYDCPVAGWIRLMAAQADGAMAAEFKAARVLIAQGDTAGLVAMLNSDVDKRARAAFLRSRGSRAALDETQMGNIEHSCDHCDEHDMVPGALAQRLKDERNYALRDAELARERADRAHQQLEGAVRHWWLCPECLNAFETEAEGRGHWADDECQAVCGAPLVEVAPSTNRRSIESDEEQE